MRMLCEYNTFPLWDYIFFKDFSRTGNNNFKTLTFPGSSTTVRTAHTSRGRRTPRRVCVRSGHGGPHLWLRGVVCVVGVVVFAQQGGLDAGRVEEAAQLLLLALSQAVDDAARLLLLLQGGRGAVSVWTPRVFVKVNEHRVCRVTDRPDAFEAFLEPHAYGLLGDLFFNGVLQLFPGQQLLHLERLPNVHRAIRQHAV